MTALHDFPGDDRYELVVRNGALGGAIDPAPPGPGRALLPGVAAPARRHPWPWQRGSDPGEPGGVSGQPNHMQRSCVFLAYAFAYAASVRNAPDAIVKRRNGRAL